MLSIIDDVAFLKAIMFIFNVICLHTKHQFFDSIAFITSIDWELLNLHFNLVAIHVFKSISIMILISIPLLVLDLFIVFSLRYIMNLNSNEFNNEFSFSVTFPSRAEHSVAFNQSENARDDLSSDGQLEFGVSQIIPLKEELEHLVMDTNFGIEDLVKQFAEEIDSSFQSNFNTFSLSPFDFSLKVNHFGSDASNSKSNNSSEEIESESDQTPTDHEDGQTSTTESSTKETSSTTASISTQTIDVLPEATQSIATQTIELLDANTSTKLQFDQDSIPKECQSCPILKKEVGGLRRENNKVTLSHEREKMRFKCKIDDHEREINRLRSDRDEKRAECEQQKVAIDDLISSVEAEKRRVEAEKKRTEKMRCSYQEVDKECKKLKEDLREERSKSSKLSRELSRAPTKTLERQLSEAREEKRCVVAIMEGEKNDIRSQMNDLQTENASSRREIQSLHLRVQELQGEVDTSEAQCDSLLSQKKILQSEHEVLRVAHHNLQSTHENFVKNNFGQQHHQIQRPRIVVRKSSKEGRKLAGLSKKKEKNHRFLKWCRTREADDKEVSKSLNWKQLNSKHSTGCWKACLEHHGDAWMMSYCFDQLYLLANEQNYHLHSDWLVKYQRYLLIAEHVAANLNNQHAQYNAGIDQVAVDYAHGEQAVGVFQDGQLHEQYEQHHHQVDPPAQVVGNQPHQHSVSQNDFHQPQVFEQQQWIQNQEDHVNPQIHEPPMPLNDFNNTNSGSSTLASTSSAPVQSQGMAASSSQDPSQDPTSTQPTNPQSILHSTASSSNPSTSAQSLGAAGQASGSNRVLNEDDEEDDEEDENDARFRAFCESQHAGGSALEEGIRDEYGDEYPSDYDEDD